MAVETTPRLALNTWPLGTDPYRREHRNADAATLDELAAMDAQGTLAARPAPSAANRGLYYFVTGDGTPANNGNLYRSTGAAWVQLPTESGGVAYDSARLGGMSAPLYLLASDASAAYLLKTGKAADSELLDGLEPSAFATAGHSHAATASGIWLPPGAFAASAGAPSLGVLTAGRWSAWLMDASASEDIAASWDMPSTWATVNVDLYWTNAGAGAGNVVWYAILDNAADGAALTASGPNDTVTVTAPAQNVLKVTRLVTNQALTAANLMNLRIFREGPSGSDTLGNDAGVLGASITQGA